MKLEFFPFTLHKWMQSLLFLILKCLEASFGTPNLVSFKILRGTRRWDFNVWIRIKFLYISHYTWRRRWHPTPVLLPGKSHGQGAWKAAVHGVAEDQARLSDFTFTFHFPALEKEMATHSSVPAWRIPGTGGAWWAAVYGVAQSRTRLKQHSSSSSSSRSRSRQ